MEAFWIEVTELCSWGKYVFIRCSNCAKTPLENEEQEVLSPYCPWCGCKMTNAEEE